MCNPTLGLDPGGGLGKGSTETWRAARTQGPAARGVWSLSKWEQEESLPGVGKLLSTPWEGQS